MWASAGRLLARIWERITAEGDVCCLQPLPFKTYPHSRSFDYSTHSPFPNKSRKEKERREEIFSLAKCKSADGTQAFSSIGLVFFSSISYHIFPLLFSCEIDVSALQARFQGKGKRNETSLKTRLRNSDPGCRIPAAMGNKKVVSFKRRAKRFVFLQEKGYAVEYTKKDWWKYLTDCSRVILYFQ